MQSSESSNSTIPPIAPGVKPSRTTMRSTPKRDSEAAAGLKRLFDDIDAALAPTSPSQSQSPKDSPPTTPELDRQSTASATEHAAAQQRNDAGPNPKKAKTHHNANDDGVEIPKAAVPVLATPWKLVPEKKLKKRRPKEPTIMLPNRRVHRETPKAKPATSTVSTPIAGAAETPSRSVAAESKDIADMKAVQAKRANDAHPSAPKSTPQGQAKRPTGPTPNGTPLQRPGNAAPNPTSRQNVAPKPVNPLEHRKLQSTKPRASRPTSDGKPKAKSLKDILNMAKRTSKGKSPLPKPRPPYRVTKASKDDGNVLTPAERKAISDNAKLHGQLISLQMGTGVTSRR